MTTRNLPPIIILLLDAAGAKHCSLYGHHRRTTPHLEQIASEAAVYRRCFSAAPWTIPSHASLFTGLYPHEHGGHTALTGMPEGLLYLPEILKDMGYHTAAVSSNLMISRVMGFARGFDEFYEMGSLFQDTRYLQARSQYMKEKKALKGDWDKIKFILKYMAATRDVFYPIKKNLDRYYKKYFANSTRSTLYMTKRSLRLVRQLIRRYQEQSSPFFLFVNLLQTHAVFKAPYPFNQKFQKLDPNQRKRLADPKIDDRIYEEDPELRAERAAFWDVCLDQEIAYTDHLVGEFYNFLREQKLLDRVLLVVTSDHGESMGEHGLFGHAFAVYNELLHIPMIVKYPKDYRVQGDFARLTQLHDLFATLSEIVDSPWPIPLSSQSLLDGSRDYVLGSLVDNSRGIDWLKRRYEDFPVHTCMLPGHAWIGADFWKLIQWQNGVRELYDLNTDLYEAHNLIEEPQFAQQAAALQGQLDDYLTFGGIPG